MDHHGPDPSGHWERGFGGAMYGVPPSAVNRQMTGLYSTVFRGRPGLSFETIRNMELRRIRERERRKERLARKRMEATTGRQPRVSHLVRRSTGTTNRSIRHPTGDNSNRHGPNNRSPRRPSGDNSNHHSDTRVNHGVTTSTTRRSEQAASSRPPCKWFNSEGGCRRGASCKY